MSKRNIHPMMILVALVASLIMGVLAVNFVFPLLPLVFRTFNLGMGGLLHLPFDDASAYPVSLAFPIRLILMTAVACVSFIAILSLFSLIRTSNVEMAEAAKPSDFHVVPEEYISRLNRLYLFGISVVAITALLVGVLIYAVNTLMVALMLIVLTSGGVGYSAGYAAHTRNRLPGLSPRVFLAVTISLSAVLALGTFAYASASYSAIIGLLWIAIFYGTNRARRIGVFRDSRNRFEFVLAFGIYVWTVALVALELIEQSWEWLGIPHDIPYVSLIGRLRIAVTLVFACLIIVQAMQNVFRDSFVAGKTNRPGDPSGHPSTEPIWELLLELARVPYLMWRSFMHLLNVVRLVIVEIKNLLSRYILNWRLIANIAIDAVCLGLSFTFLWFSVDASVPVISYIRGTASASGVLWLVAVHLVCFLYGIWMLFYLRFSDGLRRISMYLFAMVVAEIVSGVVLIVVGSFLGSLGFVHSSFAPYFQVSNSPVTILVGLGLLASGGVLVLAQRLKDQYTAIYTRNRKP
jgi:hypothetical protein